MARRGRPKEPLPPPLPHETRPIGQVIAEAIRLYGRRFWPSLALGVGPAVTLVGVVFIPGWWDLAFALIVGAPLMTASYIGGVLLASGERPPRKRVAVAFAVGVVLFVPALFLYSFFILPAVVWLGAFGLAVPAALLEGRGYLGSLRRGFELCRADPMHAIGSLGRARDRLVPDGDGAVRAPARRQQDRALVGGVRVARLHLAAALPRRRPALLRSGSPVSIEHPKQEERCRPTSCSRA